MATSGKEKRQQDQITATGSVSAVGQRFRFVASGLWAGAVVAFAATIFVAKMAPFPQKGDIMFLLGAGLGGIMATAVMHGRLADNRAELGRVREELDRKAKEYSQLLGKVLKHPRSSRGNGGGRDED